MVDGNDMATIGADCSPYDPVFVVTEGRAIEPAAIFVQAEDFCHPPDTEHQNLVTIWAEGDRFGIEVTSGLQCPATFPVPPVDFCT